MPGDLVDVELDILAQKIGELKESIIKTNRECVKLRASSDLLMRKAQALIEKVDKEPLIDFKEIVWICLGVLAALFVVAIVPFRDLLTRLR